MKKSRIAKLALMGASITALAATLTTSTYAWYVTNKVANVTGGTGTTGEAGSDGSILLSWTGNENTWFKSISFTDEDCHPTKNNALQPIKWISNNFYGMNDVNPTTATEQASNAYIQFTIHLKSGQAYTVTPVLTLTTTKQDSNHGQIAYLGTAGSELPTGAEQGKAFIVDALKALYCKQDVTAAQSAGVTASTSYVAGTSTESGGDAHEYYTAVTGNTLGDTFTTTSAEDAHSTSLAPIVFTAAGETTITYSIFLDGGDTDCYNSCAGWNIAFNLKFTATTPQNQQGGGN